MAGERITPERFVADWRGRNLTERAGSHAHFIQLCRLLGVPAPYDDPTSDDSYCFDAVTATAGSRVYAAARKTKPAPGRKKTPPAPLFGEGGGTPAQPDDAPDAPLSRIVAAGTEGHGFADVWKRGCFCWEYKRQGKHANLPAALAQLKQYRDSLDNPPLLIVCDVDHFEIHTNFTGYPSETYAFTLADLAEPSAEWREQRGIAPVNLLRRAFDPREVEWFKPGKTVNAITEERAADFAAFALELRDPKRRGGPSDPHAAAHFLMQVVFTLFAEDTGLLPGDIFTELARATAADPDRFHRRVRTLFEQMESGGDFGVHPVEHFNGGLFRGVRSQAFPTLFPTEIGRLGILATSDWSAIEPSILGTLFERALDPDKRAQIGAHYTSRDDIMLIVEPVVMDPLRRGWKAIQAEAAALIARRDKARSDAAKADAQARIADSLKTFAGRLASVRILDPACGSGNFLYVAIQCLLDLEKEVIAFGARPEVGVRLRPKVNPTQLHGIEINTYAAELARVSIWIGFLKWKRENGLYDKRRPILHPLDTIENRDAILGWVDERGGPIPEWRPGAACRGPAQWPEADFIIGNPPFLGSKLFRKWGMSDGYISAMFEAFDLPNTSDLCCYWFELARRAIEKNKDTRVGLLATQGIRGGDNRTVLERIKESGDIFMAWSDRDWVLDGAAVQVSMVGFDSGDEEHKSLDGADVSSINADLSTGSDLASAGRLAENTGIAFMGDTKGGAFDVPWKTAAEFYSAPNSHGRSNAQIVKPWVNGLDVTRRERAMFIIDFGTDATVADAALYEEPFSHLERHVKPLRATNRRSAYAAKWWLHVEPRPALRSAIAGLSRFLCTPILTKHRLFAWVEHPTLPDHQLIVFARSDGYFFGVLHSCVHEVWARATGTQLREAESGFRYTPTSCFETFPLPWSPGSEPASPGRKHHALWRAIGEAAAELDRLREAWLNPPEWIAAVERQVDIKYREPLDAVSEDARPLVRRSAVMAEAARDNRLRQRTLTNLYNERPAWLRLAHERLDRAVLAAYAGVDPEGRWQADWAKAYEPYGAGEIAVKETGRSPDTPEEAARKRAAQAAREQVDQRILANLLRLNHARAGAAK